MDENTSIFENYAVELEKVAAELRALSGNEKVRSVHPSLDINFGTYSSQSLDIGFWHNMSKLTRLTITITREAEGAGE
jgi:hypothetical protein